MTYTFDITPTPAPRMSQRDRFSPSRAASKYFSFRNNLCYLANLKSLDSLPGTLDSLVFRLPMPASWSSKKQNEMRGTPHEQTPDVDNLLKGFL